MGNKLKRTLDVANSDSARSPVFAKGCRTNCMDPSSPGFKQTARLVLPVLRHSEQLLQASHGFLHRWMRRQADSLVDEPPHGLQSQGGGLSAGLLHALQPARLLQPHSEARQLGQLHVEVEADVQQALDLGDAGKFIGQDLLAVLLEVLDTVQEFLKDMSKCRFKIIAFAPDFNINQSHIHFP